MKNKLIAQPYTSFSHKTDISVPLKVIRMNRSLSGIFRRREFAFGQFSLALPNRNKFTDYAYLNAILP